jgi:hypothetical protein
MACDTVLTSTLLLAFRGNRPSRRALFTEDSCVYVCVCGGGVRFINDAVSILATQSRMIRLYMNDAQERIWREAAVA